MSCPAAEWLSLIHILGLLANAVWAHQSVDARGSKTASVYEELTDGRADSLAWLDGELFDFVMVKDDRLTGNASASFETVLNWWANVCGSRNAVSYTHLDVYKRQPLWSRAS